MFEIVFLYNSTLDFGIALQVESIPCNVLFALSSLFTYAVQYVEPTTRSESRLASK